MKLIQFKELINSMPLHHHAFLIKEKNWSKEKCNNQRHLIDGVFKEGKATISRGDLYASSSNLEAFVIKILMWGYPTMGRGKNIEKMLEPSIFNSLIERLQTYSNTDVSNDELQDCLKSITGLGLSTLSKFTNFLGTTVGGNKALILDLQIIATLKVGPFEEFELLRKLTYDNAPRRYSEYCSHMTQWANELETEPEKLEMFLFTFGRSLA